MLVVFFLMFGCFDVVLMLVCFCLMFGCVFNFSLFSFHFSPPTFCGILWHCGPAFSLTFSFCSTISLSPPPNSIFFFHSSFPLLPPNSFLQTPSSKLLPPTPPPLPSRHAHTTGTGVQQLTTQKLATRLILAINTVS